MVEKYAIAGEHVVCFAVIFYYPIAVQFCHRIGGAGIEGGFFTLGNFNDLAVEFACRGLVEFGLFIGFADGVEQSDNANGVNISRVFRHFKGNFYMGLGGKVVYFIGLGFLNDPFHAA